jgi:hypothetical protein
MSADKIRRYIDQAPEAISGQGGHSTTLRVARSLYNGFGLPCDQVFDWLKVYNQRLADKWTNRQLMHKAEAAAAGTYDKHRGWMKADTETTVLSYSQRSAMVRETVVHAPKYHPKGTKIGPVFTREACFTTETTVLSESQRGTYARARANQPHWDWKTTVVTVPKWTDEQIRSEHRPLWRMDEGGIWRPLNDAARDLVQAASQKKKPASL